MNKLIILVVFCFVLFIGYTSHSKTPDGMTPAEETVCDAYTGAAFGLCNAYCEAMDCDSENTKASDTACEKVLANFKKKTGEDLVCGLTCDDIIVQCVKDFEVCINTCLETDCQNCDVTPEGAFCETDEQEVLCKSCLNNCRETAQECAGDCIPPPTRCDDLAPDACSDACEIVNPITGESRSGQCRLTDANVCFCAVLDR